MYKDIIVNRIGRTKNSYMITNKIIRNIYPNVNYKILLQNLLPLPEYTINKKYIYQESIPKFIDVPHIWDHHKKILKGNNNILGDFGTLITDSEIKVPINIANHNNVKYYNAELYNLYDIIKFKTKDPLPLTHMSIGIDYVKDYIENENLGGGQYLEIHDNPHFHAPLNANNKGYYLLGKIVKDKLRLSAFYIPFYKAIYTSGFIIHSDANLVGDWLVVYSKTDNYSTVLLQDSKNKMTKITFQ